MAAGGIAPFAAAADAAAAIAARRIFSTPAAARACASLPSGLPLAPLATTAALAGVDVFGVGCCPMLFTGACLPVAFCVACFASFTGSGAGFGTGLKRAASCLAVGCFEPALPADLLEDFADFVGGFLDEDLLDTDRPLAGAFADFCFVDLGGAFAAAGFVRDLCPEFFFCAGFAGGVDLAAGALVGGAFARAGFGAGASAAGGGAFASRGLPTIAWKNPFTKPSAMPPPGIFVATILSCFLELTVRPALSPNNAFALSLARGPTRKLIHPDQAGAGFSRSRVGRIGRKPFHFTSSARDGRTARQSPRSKLRCRQVQPGVPGRPSGGRNLLRSGRRPARVPLPVAL